MKSYYEVLGIGQDADAAQIKRAYFKLVREYPPEHFPEEFKDLREAYDTLTNEESRAEYNRGNGLPSHIRSIFAEAQKARKAELPEKALEILLGLQNVYPDLAPLKVELANIYEDMEKFGKAIEIWKQLYSRAPDNAEYSLGLARSYGYRGWNKKAAEQYERTTVIDPSNGEAWSGWITYCADSGEFKKAKEICEKALMILNESHKAGLPILTDAFMLSTGDGDKQAALRYLRKIRDLLLSGMEYDKYETETMFTMIVEVSKRSGNIDALPFLKDIAAFLPGLSEEINNQIRDMEVLTEIKALENEGVPSLLSEMFEILLIGCGCDDCTSSLMALECNILADLDGYRPYILRLKTNHPSLYKMHSIFFREAVLSGNPDKMLNYRLKVLSKKGLEPNFVPAEAESQQLPETVRRDGLKIGRNDPCPCGSGKKYKKCCG